MASPSTAAAYAKCAEMLPDPLRVKAIQVWGEQGHEWAANFPRLLAAARERWDLNEVTPAQGLSYNFVGFSSLADGQPVVLKMAARPGDLRREADALRILGSHLAPKVIGEDKHLRALLLERVQPGESLWESWALDRDDEHTEIAARLMAENSVPANEAYPSTESWFGAFDRCLRGMPDRIPDRPTIEKARDVGRQLHAAAEKSPRFLHGDLHHGNILRSGGSWKIIDPKGVNGPTEFEVGTFLRNPADRLEGLGNLRNLIDRRLEIFAQILDCGADSLRAWCFCACVMSACWSFEDNEGGELAVRCARVLGKDL